MFRTRDFILIFTAVVFLLFAISTTLWNQHKSEDLNSETIILAEVDDSSYAATLATPESLSKDERLAVMRRKIAEGGEIVISAPEPVSEEEIESEVVAIEQDLITTQRCPGYREFAGSWRVDGILFDIVESYRIVYREVESIPVQTASGTSPASNTKRNILLQLPVRSAPTSNASCLSTDVIGVAQDGSLIRNNEARLYGVFGSNTLVGYALDGFPIFGISSRPSDKCGGHMENGQYGYYLSDERDTILNCFSATPTSI